MGCSAPGSRRLPAEPRRSGGGLSAGGAGGSPPRRPAEPASRPGSARPGAAGRAAAAVRPCAPAVVCCGRRPPVPGPTRGHPRRGRCLAAASTAGRARPPAPPGPGGGKRRRRRGVTGGPPPPRCGRRQPASGAGTAAGVLPRVGAGPGFSGRGVGGCTSAAASESQPVSPGVGGQRRCRAAEGQPGSSGRTPFPPPRQIAGCCEGCGNG